ncbi:MAG: nuclear transport factor 2 family protein [Solirubrobacterales bacterium]
MSEENVELVQRGIKDVDAFWAMLDEYVVWDLRDRPAPPDLDSVYVGRDAVIQASRHYWGTWDGYRVEAEELLDAGTSVVVILRECGRGKGSGAPFDSLHPQLWTFRGGRIIRWDSFQTRADALEAAGLSE